MPWRSLGKLGNLYETSSLGDYQEGSKAEHILKKTIELFAQKVGKFHHNVGWLPFYREKQIHSILLPSIEQVADASIMELPIRRRQKRVSFAGFLDYCVLYKNVVLAIEVKHSWHSMLTDGPNKSNNRHWRKGI